MPSIEISTDDIIEVLSSELRDSGAQFRNVPELIAAVEDFLDGVEEWQGKPLIFRSLWDLKIFLNDNLEIVEKGSGYASQLMNFVNFTAKADETEQDIFDRLGTELEDNGYHVLLNTDTFTLVAKP